MADGYEPGDRVQTPFGKGVVREVRNGGRLLVDVHGRALVTDGRDVQGLSDRPRPRPSHGPAAAARADADPPGGRVEVDLHGLTVEEALVRMDDVLNEALLAGAPELRIIHGRSGGRLRSAVHARLRAMPSIRGFGMDPRNEGVTVVVL